jgi:hypothetical protein
MLITMQKPGAVVLNGDAEKTMRVAFDGIEKCDLRYYEESLPRPSGKLRARDRALLTGAIR